MELYLADASVIPLIQKGCWVVLRGSLSLSLHVVHLENVSCERGKPS